MNVPARNADLISAQSFPLSLPNELARVFERERGGSLPPSGGGFPEGDPPGGGGLAALDAWSTDARLRYAVECP